MSAHSFSEGDHTEFRAVYVNAYKDLSGAIRFTRGYDTRDQAAAMRTRGRGKSVRYVNRIPLIVIVDING